MENHPDDWLLAIELYELCQIGDETDLAKKILKHLDTIKHDKPEFGRLIDDGLGIINSKTTV